MNWGKLLKEVTRIIIKNWYYIVPPVLNGIRKIYNKIKKKKENNSPN